MDFLKEISHGLQNITFRSMGAQHQNGIAEHGAQIVLTKAHSQVEALLLSGIFVGFSSCHSSLVPLAINVQTGRISPQFHAVFDYWFTSVTSVGGDEVFDPTL